MKIYFDHEKLDVYREAINFCGWVDEFLASISAKAAAKDQLDRASTSIPLNIAEGNGKFSARDRARFFEMARGSTLECAACLDVLLVRKVTKEELVAAQKDASFGSSKCSSACCVGSLTGQMFCGRKRRITYPNTSTITITSMSRRKTGETFSARS